MRQRGLARPRARPAADDRRRRRAVMRRAERRPRDERPLRRRRGPRPSGCGSPPAPRPARAAAGSPGSRRASIVLPVPGGPASSRLCRPAAAISSARRARSWPRTSARSGSGGSAALPFAAAPSGSSRSPRRYATASARWRTRHGLDAGERRLGRRLGRDRAAGRARRARALGDRERRRRPRRTRPSSASSPTAACSSSRSCGICRDAARIASAIGRSNAEPSLRSCAGARLTVIRLPGHSSSADAIAAAHAVLRLLARAVDEPDDREAGTPSLDVRFDVDASRLQADEGVRDGAREHPTPP